MTAMPYTTKDLSTSTWHDFEDLFSRGNGWDFCWCMHFHRHRSLPKSEFRTRPQQAVRNKRDKRELVRKRQSHGIVVYADDEPVGWCQFGPREELPRHDASPKYRRSPAETDTDQLWRITCFVVDKRHRRRGVAGIALRAALEAIRKRGGRVVEAYPIAAWSSDPRVPPAGVYVEGVGRVPPVHGTFGNVTTQGTVAMFEKEGFTAVAVIGKDHVLMRRTV